MEQAQPDLMPREHLDQFQLGLVQFPAGGQETAILVAVGIPEHHFLRAAAAGQQPRVGRQGQQPVHRAGAVLQVADGLE